MLSWGTLVSLLCVLCDIPKCWLILKRHALLLDTIEVLLNGTAGKLADKAGLQLQGHRFLIFEDKVWSNFVEVAVKYLCWLSMGMHFLLVFWDIYERSATVTHNMPWRESSPHLSACYCVFFFNLMYCLCRNTCFRLRVKFFRKPFVWNYDIKRIIYW